MNGMCHVLYGWMQIDLFKIESQYNGIIYMCILFHFLVFYFPIWLWLIILGLVILYVICRVFIYSDPLK